MTSLQRRREGSKRDGRASVPDSVDWETIRKAGADGHRGVSHCPPSSDGRVFALPHVVRFSSVVTIRSLTRRWAAQPIQYKQSNGRRQVGLDAGLVDLTHQVGQGHRLAMRYVLQTTPECIFRLTLVLCLPMTTECLMIEEFMSVSSCCKAVIPIAFQFFRSPSRAV